MKEKQKIHLNPRENIFIFATVIFVLIILFAVLHLCASLFTLTDDIAEWQSNNTSEYHFPAYLTPMFYINGNNWVCQNSNGTYVECHPQIIYVRQVEE